MQAAPLRAPDLFSADAGHPTGLPQDLWKGASADLARTVIPMAVTRPMSPAAQAFAVRLMSTGSVAPDGGGADAELAAARIYVVLSLGDAIGARTMLEHTPAVRQSAALSQVAAEADLVIGREDEACSLGDNLAAGKDSPYFRRLRAFCLYKAGDKAGAQLAYDLTEEQAKDDVYKRLMGAAVSGAQGAQAGAPSLRNGIEYALSRQMGLDLTPAMDKAWAPVATVVARDPQAQATAQAAAAAAIARRQADMNRASSLNPAVRDAALSVDDDKLSADLAERLAAAGVSGLDGGAAGAGALRGGRRAGLQRGQGGVRRLRRRPVQGQSGADAGAGRGLGARRAGRRGPGGPVADDGRGRGGTGRGRPGAHRPGAERAGFGEDARRYALEGLLALQPPPAAPPPPPKAAKKPPPKGSKTFAAKKKRAEGN